MTFFKVVDFSLQKPRSGGFLLRDAGLEIHSGDTLALTGPTGGGKSCFFKALVGLFPYQGEVFLQGRKQPEWPAENFRSQVLYLSQQAHFEGASLRDNLRRPWGWKAHKGKIFPEKKLLRYFDIVGWQPTRMEELTGHFSGGEKQIAHLLRALLLDPQLLLLDEPTSSLDQQTAGKAEDLVKCWHEENSGRSVFWITHSIEQARRVARRQFVLEAGRLQG